MANFTRQQLYAALQSLPPAIKDIVLSVEKADIFHEIMRRHNLTVAQIGLVANEIAPITVGLVLPDTLRLNLKRQLPELSEDALNKLIADIDGLYLKDIRDKIVALAHQNKAGPAAQATVTTSPAPSVARVAAPTPPRPPTTDIAQAKLAGNVHLPSDSVKVTEPASAAATTPQKPPSPVQGNSYTKGADPYREPLA